MDEPRFHTLRIEGTGISARGYKIYLDGMEVKAVRSLKLEMDVNGANIVALEMTVAGVAIDTHVLTELVARAKRDEEEAGDGTDA